MKAPAPNSRVFEPEPVSRTIAKPALPTTSPSFRPGVLIAGKYRIERQLAEGGIGVIVAAQDVALGRPVAIKYLKPSVLSQSKVVDRFQREARMVARLRSEHVVRVHDVGVLPGGGPYMVMEHLEGRDLGHMVREAPLPVTGAVDCVLQACDAMAEAHAVGIVHRDLKPENLFLARHGGGAAVVKVLDFGISKITPRAEDLAHGPRATDLGETFGTPVYMSPEQLHSSANVDARTDIWALGVVLFELMTGQMPFDGDTVPQLCTSILGDPPKSLRCLCPDAPPGLEAVVLRCLQKDREQRYSNVAELAVDLVHFGPGGAGERVERMKRVLRDSGAVVRSVPPPPHVTLVAVPGPRARRVAVIGVLTAAALALGLLVAICRPHDAPLASQPPVAPAVVADPARTEVADPTIAAEDLPVAEVPAASAHAPSRVPRGGPRNAPSRAGGDYSEFGGRQ